MTKEKRKRLFGAIFTRARKRAEKLEQEEQALLKEFVEQIQHSNQPGNGKK